MSSRLLFLAIPQWAYYSGCLPRGTSRLAGVSRITGHTEWPGFPGGWQRVQVAGPIPAVSR